MDDFTFRLHMAQVEAEAFIAGLRRLLSNFKKYDISRLYADYVAELGTLNRIEDYFRGEVNSPLNDNNITIHLRDIENYFVFLIKSHKKEEKLTDEEAETLKEEIELLIKDYSF